MHVISWDYGAVPDFVPAEIKLPMAVTAWLVGIIGFSVKEALGG